MMDFISSKDLSPTLRAKLLVVAHAAENLADAMVEFFEAMEQEKETSPAVRAVVSKIMAKIQNVNNRTKR